MLKLSEEELLSENYTFSLFDDFGNNIECNIIYLCEIKDKKYAILHDNLNDNDIIFNLIEKEKDIYDYKIVEDPKLIDIICKEYYEDENY